MQKTLTNTEVRSLALNGITIQNVITQNSLSLPNESYFEPYIFESKKGQKLTIEMTSNQIDPSLILLYYDKKQETFVLVTRNDDIALNDASSQISVILPNEGIYMIWANAFEPGETGNYSIKAFVE